MLRDIGPASKEDNLDRVEEIARRDDQINILEAEILAYLGRIRQGMLTGEESREVERLDAIDPDYLKLARLQMSFVDQMRRKPRDYNGIPDSGAENPSFVFRRIDHHASYSRAPLQDHR
jgi:Na+/phosphate symporter